MSSKTTELTAKTEEYLNGLFSAEDEFLSGLRSRSLQRGLPDIAISGLQASFLQFLIKSINAENILEIGSLGGFSAISMARALPPTGKLTALEINPDYAAYISLEARDAGLENIISVVNTDAKTFLRDYKPSRPLDLVFIDADKTSYIEYLDLVTPLLKKGGIVAVDNALAFGMVAQSEITDDEEVSAIREFNIYLADHPAYQSCIVTLGDGMAMGVKLI
jgi:caffeoyl-CoA O-methyltransferase